MNYDNIMVEDEVNTVVSAVEQGKMRLATKRESMAVRLAVLSDIVHELQVIVKNDKELSTATRI
jgi:energy-converting hydrogenase A subunit M